MREKIALIPSFLFLFGGFRFPPFFMFADGVGLLLLMSWFRNRIWMVVNDFNSPSSSSLLLQPTFSFLSMKRTEKEFDMIISSWKKKKLSGS